MSIVRGNLFIYRIPIRNCGQERSCVLKGTEKDCARICNIMEKWKRGKRDNVGKSENVRKSENVGKSENVKMWGKVEMWGKVKTWGKVKM